MDDNEFHIYAYVLKASNIEVVWTAAKYMYVHAQYKLKTTTVQATNAIQTSSGMNILKSQPTMYCN